MNFYLIAFHVIYSINQEDEIVYPLFLKVGTVIVATLVFGAIIYSLFKFIERFWVRFINPKPFYKHFYLKKKKLTSDQLFILKNELSFYQQLKPRYKRFFEHRVATLIDTYEFISKSGMRIDDQQKVLIAGTSAMLTFGYREYKLNSVQRVLIYPKVYYSRINKTHHKGEYNPAYKAIVFSWEDFLEGYNIDNDKFNLGIHEFVHAMHFEYLDKNNHSANALIFVHHYEKLKRFLKSNPRYRRRLLSSKYLRNYAFTNNFEFIAVVIEAFIETPSEFKSQFPEMYRLVRKMLNFNFSGY